MFAINVMPKSEKEKVLPLLFQLLATNMNEIAPTGNTFEQDYQMWKGFMDSGIECPERQILLITADGRIVGYFQYLVREETLLMEDIQIDRAYWGTGAFQTLYQYLARTLSGGIRFVEADASKQNLKSQGILRHLGLEVVKENPNGRSYRFRGDCKKMLDMYR